MPGNEVPEAEKIINDFGSNIKNDLKLKLEISEFLQRNERSKY